MMLLVTCKWIQANHPRANQRTKERAVVITQRRSHVGTELLQPTPTWKYHLLRTVPTGELSKRVTSPGSTVFPPSAGAWLMAIRKAIPPQGLSFAWDPGNQSGWACLSALLSTFLCPACCPRNSVSHVSVTGTIKLDPWGLISHKTAKEEERGKQWYVDVLSA